MCIPELLCLCFFGEVVWAGVQLELSLYPGHVVVGQPHYALMVRAPTPRHRIGVTICASGNFWLGARGRILRLPGHQSIYRLAGLGQLEATAASFLGSLQWLLAGA